MSWYECIQVCRESEVQMSIHTKLAVAAVFSLAAGSGLAGGFNAGSTGADGSFAPTANVTLTPPDSGVYNFTDVNIPAGVTVTFGRNTSNTAVVILATGSVTIGGTIDVSGKNAQDYKSGRINFPEGGQGGPGGFNGGRGGDSGGAGRGGVGLGVGGGRGGMYPNPGGCGYVDEPEGGGGGGYGVAGQPTYCIRGYGVGAGRVGVGGVVYGSNTALPVIGGSGGGGGAGALKGTGSTGGGGGGGGGAILIAANGTVQISGTIRARGGNGAGVYGGCNGYSRQNDGAPGGGGSGGMIRIMASSIVTGGTLDVAGGVAACNEFGWFGAGNGGGGRVSTETVPGGTLNFSGLPSIALTQIGGINVPVAPTGAGDVSLPLTQPNPVSVNIAAKNIPMTAIIKLTMTPVYGGDAVTVDASPLAGSFETSTTTASINLPNGPSVLTAYVSYTLTLAMGNALSTYAMGERVEKVTLATAQGQEMQATLITVSGREFKVHPSVLMMMSTV
jgi:hypothetical protein